MTSLTDIELYSKITKARGWLSEHLGKDDEHELFEEILARYEGWVNELRERALPEYKSEAYVLQDIKYPFTCEVCHGHKLRMAQFIDGGSLTRQCADCPIKSHLKWGGGEENEK